MQKVDDSAKLMYKAISHSVIDNVGVFTLLFRKPENEGYLTSIVKFKFNEIIYLDENCFIMQGITEMPCDLAYSIIKSNSFESF